jgi:hypothetical protein
MNRQQRTPKILRDASEHLFYEYGMFNSLAQAMASGIFGPGLLNNAALESFALHARTLLDFLYAENLQTDDVIAEDYFDESSQWLTVRPEKTETLNMIRKKVGKQIAHLTYTRLKVTTEDRQWLFIQIASEINTIFDVFLNNVAENRLCPSLISIKNKGKDKNT